MEGLGPVCHKPPPRNRSALRPRKQLNKCLLFKTGLRLKKQKSKATDGGGWGPRAPLGGDAEAPNENKEQWGGGREKPPTPGGWWKMTRVRKRHFRKYQKKRRERWLSRLPRAHPPCKTFGHRKRSGETTNARHLPGHKWGHPKSLRSCSERPRLNLMSLLINLAHSSPVDKKGLSLPFLGTRLRLHNVGGF